MGGKSGSQTIGYHYFMSLLFGIGRGPVDELVQIKVGDKVAWNGSLTATGYSTINRPGLFGGEKKEGGIQGPFRLFMGELDQVLPAAGPSFSMFGPYGTQTLPAVKTTIGGLVSDLRGVTTIWYDGLISSMNPYPKEWKFRVRRALAGWQDDDTWYPLRAQIPMAAGAIMAMNPAHIIYECLTNKLWGRGLPAALVDGQDGGSFIGAANTLYDEGFGLCFIWTREDDIDAFINTVLEHIGATLFLNRATGQMTLRLIRNDYDPEDLPLFTPSSGLLEIVEDDSSSQDATFNEVYGTGKDPINDLDIRSRVHNLAARHSQGAANSQPKDYPGIPTKELLVRVLQRDLRQYAAGLKKFNVRLDHKGYKLQPGSLFRIQDTRRGIVDIILRVGEVVDPPLRKDSGGISIKALQDVFGLPLTSYVTPIDSTWEPPPDTAFPPLAERLIEAGYRETLLRIGEANIALAMNETSAIATVAAAPNTTTVEYGLATKAEGETDFVVRATGSFTGTGTLQAAIGALDTTLTLENVVSIGAEHEGQAILIDDEYMTLVDYNEGTGGATVERGVMDSVPAEHALGARAWTSDDDLQSDNRAYVSGETIEAKVLTRTSSEMLDQADADTLSIDLVGRISRPYPPGDVKLDAVSIYELVGDQAGALDLTWAHRDRLLQSDTLVPHEAASIGPEDTVTYNVRVLDFLDPDTVLYSEPAIAGATYNLAAALVAAGDPVYAWIELESERDSLTSFQKYRFALYLPGSGGGHGYGYDYGENYGGA